MSADRPRVRALLGPTNTGKTHRAIQAMLAHRSGMIGLPLRLLAREVYDRIVALRGEHQVALITGEEKRVPAAPRWYVCTVEAMPLDRRVAFLAIDEVQLAGDRQRGHTFTDRLLHARGTLETWFLGADTIHDVLVQLVPEVEVETAHRLSTLRHAGQRKLTSLPSRTAVVAFSAEQVYAQAERLRAVHGGAAVVLGALSPRTRNAQVALYQAGEVQHLVATDAIGMGLNMDVEHVAFSAMRKFDGHRFRDLLPAEVGQIAGRAGRYKTDGTFGSTRDVGLLPTDVVDAVERHAFAPLTRLYWRNSALDFSSPTDLLASLERPPPHPTLRPVRNEEDHASLEELLRDEQLAARLTDGDALRRLWEVCQVPDFRQVLTAAHVQLLRLLAEHRVVGAPVPGELLDSRLDHLDRTDGDIETLMARIAWIRTWTYVSHQRGWLAQPEPVQQRARAIEDRLSDALHDQLTLRFVDRRLLWVVGGRELEGELVLDDDDVVRVGSGTVGRVVDLSFVPETGVTQKRVLAAVRRALASEALRRVKLLEEAPDDAITVDDGGRVGFDGQHLARLVSGPSPRQPSLKGQHLDLLDAEGRDRVRRRLEDWLGAWVAHLFAPLRRGPFQHLGPAGRGIVHQLEESMGAVDARSLVTLPHLPDADRKVLAKLDVRIGTRTVYVQSLLKGPAQRRKAMLWSVHQRLEPLRAPPPNGPTSLPTEGSDEELLHVLGYRVLGPRWVRVDLIERVAAHARDWARSGEPRSVDAITSWMGCHPDEATAALVALGYALGEADGGHTLTKVKKKRRSRRRRRR